MLLINNEEELNKNEKKIWRNNCNKISRNLRENELLPYERNFTVWRDGILLPVRMITPSTIFCFPPAASLTNKL